MDKYVEFAPMIVVVIGFLCAYGIFVTPKQLQNELKELNNEIEKKYVQKEVHDIAIKEIKDDFSDMKEKIDKIYDKIMGIA